MKSRNKEKAVSVLLARLTEWSTQVQLSQSDLCCRLFQTALSQLLQWNLPSYFQFKVHKMVECYKAWEEHIYDQKGIQRTGWERPFQCSTPSCTAATCLCSDAEGMFTLMEQTEEGLEMYLTCTSSNAQERGG